MTAGNGVTGQRPLRIVERNLMIYRHTWPLLLAEIFEPVLYLGAIGLGVGSLVGTVSMDAGSIVAYASFVAPALVATTAMNAAMNETTFNMFAKLRIDRIYDSILVTPLTAHDVALGEIIWSVLRGVAVSAGFIAVITAFGLVGPSAGLLMLPGVLAVSVAFAAAGLAVTTFLRDWQDFQLITLVMLPMFLFATTFYPVTVYPDAVQWLVRCLPLYHAVELIRGPALGVAGAGPLVSAAYLILMGVLGFTVARRRMRGLLLR